MTLLLMYGLMHDAIRDPETFAIIGAAMEVHGYFGAGFLEAVYREALGHELQLRSIPYRKEVGYALTYKGLLMRTSYRADMVCSESVLVEVKALGDIGGSEIAQVLNYLKASGLKRGLLLNFGTRTLQYRRLILSGQQSAAPKSSQ
ncbi:MAG: GxxExxY protein [Gemmatimonadota bacterium]